MKKYIQQLTYFILTSLSFSCTNQFYSIADFNKIEKIDTHIHLNSTNTALAEQAKLDNFKILAVNVDVPGNYPPVAQQFEFATFQKNKFPDQVEKISAFNLNNWKSPNWEAETIAKLKSDFALGALGIKIWKNIGMVYRDTANKLIMIDNPRFDKVINYIIGQDKTIMGHLAEPKNCWLPLDSMTVNNDRNYFSGHPEFHMYLHPDMPSYEAQIKARDNFIEHHPDMRFVAAHLGSLEWSVDELAKRLDKYPNMAVDMAERICHLQHQSVKNYEKVRDFMIKYQDRIIYATDVFIDDKKTSIDAKNEVHNLWLSDWEYFVTDKKLTNQRVNGTFIGLHLPKKVIDKIFHNNAVKWFKIK
jgi:Amidohydrolase